MTIEVKQMLIKSTVLQDDGAEDKGSDPGQALAGTKEEILAACRQLIIEILREGRER